MFFANKRSGFTLVELLIVLTITLFIPIFLLNYYHEPPNRISSIYIIQGEKQTLASEKDLQGLYIQNGRKIKKVRRGMPIEEGDVIKSDGNKMININYLGNHASLRPGNAMIKINPPKKRSFDQLAGEIFYEIRYSPFFAISKLGIAGTETTRFFFSVDPNNWVFLVAIEGTVKLAPTTNYRDAEAISDGEYAEIGKDKNIKIGEIDISDYTNYLNEIPDVESGCDGFKGIKRLFFERFVYENAIVLYDMQWNLHDALNEPFTYNIDSLISNIPPELEMEILHADRHSFIGQIKYKGCTWLIDSEKNFSKI